MHVGRTSSSSKLKTCGRRALVQMLAIQGPVAGIPPFHMCTAPPIRAESLAASFAWKRNLLGSSRTAYVSPAVTEPPSTAAWSVGEGWQMPNDWRSVVPALSCTGVSSHDALALIQGGARRGKALSWQNIIDRLSRWFVFSEICRHLPPPPLSNSQTLYVSS